MTDPAVCTNAIHNNTPDGDASSSDFQEMMLLAKYAEEMMCTKELERELIDPVKYSLADQLKLGSKPVSSFVKAPKQFRHSVCRM